MLSTRCSLCSCVLQAGPASVFKGDVADPQKMFTHILSICVTILIPESHFDYPGHQQVSALCSLCVCKIPMCQTTDRVSHTRTRKAQCLHDRRPRTLVPGTSFPSLHGISTKADGQYDQGWVDAAA